MNRKGLSASIPVLSITLIRALSVVTFPLGSYSFPLYCFFLGFGKLVFCIASFLSLCTGHSYPEAMSRNLKMEELTNVCTVRHYLCSTHQRKKNFKSKFTAKCCHLGTVFTMRLFLLFSARITEVDGMIQHDKLHRINNLFT